MHPHRHIHYGRVLTAAALLALVGLLIFAIVQIVQRAGAEQASLENPQMTEAWTTPVVTEAPITEPPTEPPTLPPTEAPTEPPMTEPVEIPASIKLEVPYISQKGLLPTGCELVSAKMVLEYYGAEVSVDDIVENTKSMYPKTQNGRTYAPHPEQAFIGSPLDETSFGCYPPVIVDMMNKLLPEGKIAKDVTGMELQTLAETYLPRNTPVLVWATINMLDHFSNIGWYLYDENGEPTDEWYGWQANEHCLVLVGYDSKYYYFNDPYGNKGLVSYSRELTEKRFNSMGQYAAVVVDES